MYGRVQINEAEVLTGSYVILLKTTFLLHLYGMYLSW